MANYPQQLQPHPVFDVFKIDDTTCNLRNQLAYFHYDDFPLYMHSHDFYELNIIVKGYGRHYIEEQNFPAMPGYVFAIPPHIKHGYWASDNTMSIFHLLLTPEFMAQYGNELKTFPGFSLLFETEPQIRKHVSSDSFFLKLNSVQQNEFLPTMEKIVELALRATFPGHELLFRTYAFTLICELSLLIHEDIQSQNSTQKLCDSRSIIKTTNYMTQNLDKDFSLEELAKMASLSRTGFIEHFKALLGDTPFDYLRKQRINHAAEMLISSNYSIAFIAQECGFNDSSHFIRIFKKLMGTTPHAFRKNNKKS